MGWKEFLMPNAGKIVAFIFAIYLLNVIYPAFAQYPYEYRLERTLSTLLVTATISYLVSCAIFWNKLLAEFLRPTLWKFLAFPIVAFLLIVLPSLAGIYWYGDIGFAFLLICSYAISCAMATVIGKFIDLKKILGNDFLKPTLSKIFVFILVYLALVPLFSYPLCGGRGGGCTATLMQYYANMLSQPMALVFYAVFGVFMGYFSSPVVLLFLFIFAWTISYAISCALIYIIGRARKKQRKS